MVEKPKNACLYLLEPRAMGVEPPHFCTEEFQTIVGTQSGLHEEHCCIAGLKFIVSLQSSEFDQEAFKDTKGPEQYADGQSILMRF